MSSLQTYIIICTSTSPTPIHTSNIIVIIANVIFIIITITIIIIIIAIIIFLYIVGLLTHRITDVLTCFFQCDHMCFLIAAILAQAIAPRIGRVTDHVPTY